MTQGNSRAGREEASSTDAGAQVRSLRDDLRFLGRSFARALTLEWLHFRTQALDTGVKAALWCGVFGFFLVIFVSAGAFVALGIRDLLGNLGGGLALIGLILLLGLAFRFRLRSQGVRRAKKVLEEDDGPHES